MISRKSLIGLGVCVMCMTMLLSFYFLCSSNSTEIRSSPIRVEMCDCEDFCEEKQTTLFQKPEVLNSQPKVESGCDFGVSPVIKKNEKIKVGFLIAATGRYAEFIPLLVERFKKHVFVGQRDKWEYTIFFFVNSQNFKMAPNTVFIYQEKKKWPYSSMGRTILYLEHIEAWHHMDYLFSMDSDLLWVNDVTGEFLVADGFIATIHPSVKTKGQGRFEHRKEGGAYIPPEVIKGCWKTMGNFYGGSRKAFLKSVNMMSEWIVQDAEHKPEPLIPIWHDESYLNRYCCLEETIDNPKNKYYEGKMIYNGGKPNSGVGHPYTKLSHLGSSEKMKDEERERIAQ